jgi:predicted ATPase
MIKKIRLHGLLSFEDMELELRNLNVLIGPNGSGKSNLIEALSLLQALPTSLETILNRGGGIAAWLRKGTANEAEECSMSATLELHIAGKSQEISYEARLGSTAGRYQITHEDIRAIPGVPDADGCLDTGFGADMARESQLHRPTADRLGGPGIELLYGLGAYFESFGLYVGLGFGPDLQPRKQQPADQQFDYLAKDGRNLALVLQNAFINTGSQHLVDEEFRRFFDRFRHFSVSVQHGGVLAYMHEDGIDEPIPATRWSDGMIRYLCLLAILCHPNPPGLICIDEPELGFHPDILPNLARLIKAASERTQIIITTHSKQLVDEFSDDPEAVVVCERGFDGETTMRRLDAGKLDKWLEDYSLGDLWESGEIGGDLY